jgi:signal transduction histidine kinase
VQEALTNAVRHGAGRAAVRLEASDGVLIEVRNPRGRASSMGAGVGLLGMRERVELLGGSLEAGPVGDEWVVTARIPVGRAA